MTENTNNTMNTKISMENLKEMANEPVTAYDEPTETTSSDETTEPVANCCEGCDGQNGDCMCLPREEHNQILMDIIDNNIMQVLSDHPECRQIITDVFKKELIGANEKKTLVIESTAQALRICIDDNSNDDFVDDGVSYDRFCYRAVEILNGNTPETITDENRSELADILTAHMIAAIADGDGDTISIINKICDEYGISIDDQAVDIGVDKYLNEKNPEYDTDAKDTVTNDKKIIGIFSTTDNEDVSVATVDANGNMEISKMDKNDPITKALASAGKLIAKTQEEYQKIAVKCMKLKKKNKKLKKQIKKLEKKLGK